MMPIRRNPLPSLLLILGAGLTLGANGYDDAAFLIRYPVVLSTVVAGVVILAAFLSLASVAPGADKIGVLTATLLGGYTAYPVILTLHFTHEFRDGVVLATVGGAALLVGAALGLLEVSGAHARPAAATPPLHGGVVAPPVVLPPVAGRVTAGKPQAAPVVAPPGWYSDPAGGPGQRYWSGSSWGQEVRA